LSQHIKVSFRKSHLEGSGRAIVTEKSGMLTGWF